MRSWEFKGEQQFISLLYESNRFNVAVCVFSNRSQVQSDCGTKGPDKCVADVEKW